MKLVVTTQYQENYGTESQPYWKFKGGTEYVTPLGASVDPSVIPSLVARVGEKVSYSNAAACEYVIGWSVIGESEMTSDEALQLEYDGRITYPAPVVEVR